MNRRGLITLLASCLLAVALTLIGPRIGLFVYPWRLIFWGIAGFIVLNSLMFGFNLVLAMRDARGKSDKEVEDVFVSALEGEPKMLRVRTLEIFRLLGLMAVGFIVAGVLLLFLIR